MKISHTLILMGRLIKPNSLLPCQNISLRDQWSQRRASGNLCIVGEIFLQTAGHMHLCQLAFGNEKENVLPSPGLLSI